MLIKPPEGLKSTGMVTPVVSALLVDHGTPTRIINMRQNDQKLELFFVHQCR